MLLKNISTQDQSEDQWPHCPAVGSVCPIYSMNQILGADVQNILIDFIGGAEDGSRLTLQKNHNGFTVQVTSAVKKGMQDANTLDMASLKVIGHKLKQG